MRIVCQKCSSAYAIDDKFVTPKGVRAQCPRCRHLQLVKKDDAAAEAPPAPPAAAAPGGASPFLFDMGGAPPPAPPGSKPQSAGPMAFDFSAPPPGAATAAPAFPLPPKPPPAPPPPNAGASPFDFSAPTLGLGTSPGVRSPLAPPANAGNPFDFGAPPPPPRGQPASAPAANPFDFGVPPPPAPGKPGAAAGPFDFGAPASSPSGFDFSSPPSPGGSAKSAELDLEAGAGSPFEFGAPPPPPPAASAAAAFSELEFGAPPPPQRAAPARLSAPPAPASAAPDATVVKCRNCGKGMTDPFDQALGVCDDCRNKTAEVAAAESPFPPADSLKRTEVPMFPSASTPITTAADQASKVRSATRGGGASDGGGRGKLIGLGVAALAVLGIGGWLAVKRPWVRKPPSFINQPESARPRDAIIQQWTLKYPELEGVSADQLVADGRAALEKDTTTGYRNAETAFEKALVLDADDARAIAGWALSLAFGRGGKIDDQTLKAAEAMLGVSEQRSGDLGVYVAHAHLLLSTHGNPDHVKALAERGLNSGEARDRALAELGVGATLLAKNPQQAGERFAQALEIDPKLKRAYFFQARLAASQGKYDQAINALTQRLQLDADQWEAAEELARLWVDVGEPARAKKVLETTVSSDPHAVRPRMALAVLRYQHLGALEEAAADFKAIDADADASRAEKSEALVHLATIQRLRADPDAAQDTVRRALELTPESIPARLQQFLTYVDKGNASNARLELDGLKGQLGNELLEKTLEGRVLIAESHFEDAMKVLAEVSEKEPRRVDATLLAATAAAKAKKTGKAWEYCLRRGFHADPMSRPVPSMTTLFIRPADILYVAEGAFAALSSDLEADPSPHLCEGLVSWFLEEPEAADKHFSRATAIDSRSADGFAYRSFLAARKRDFGAALRLGQRALAGNRSSGMAWFAQARAQEALGQLDQAKLSAREAQKYDAKLLGPKVVIGDAEAAQKHPDDARTTLTSVLLADPQYQDAKKILYKHKL